MPPTTGSIKQNNTTNGFSCVHNQSARKKESINDPLFSPFFSVREFSRGTTRPRATSDRHGNLRSRGATDKYLIKYSHEYTS
jgi:hypothetical protein